MIAILILVRQAFLVQEMQVDMVGL